MGACLTHLQKEMQPIPQYSGNRDQLGPRRPEPYNSKSKSSSNSTSRSNVASDREERGRRVEMRGANGASLGRIETESGIPGLTFDAKGRPVWREENARKAETEHKEHVSKGGW